MRDHVQRWLDQRFLAGLVASPRGRGFLLNSLLDAEEADELGVFDRLRADVTDPVLARAVATHQADEERHAALLRDRLAATGLPRLPTPAHLRIVPYVDAALGDVGAAYVAGRAGAVDPYLLLQVLEERAVVQYPRFARALAVHDPATAAVVAAIAADEVRHVRYAEAVTRRLCADDGERARRLARFRRAEAAAYQAHGRATACHVLDQRLLAAAPVERALWQVLMRAPVPARA